MQLAEQCDCKLVMRQCRVHSVDLLVLATLVFLTGIRQKNLKGHLII